MIRTAAAALAALCVLPLSLAAQRQDTARTRQDTMRVHLEAIIVQSTRTGRRIEDEPIRVEVVGREEIEEKLRMTPGDISMLLNETGGVRVQTTSPALGAAAVRINGLRGRYALLLADGLPLYGTTSGLGALQIPPMDLAQVEVIKGAASALYGASALGGVINLISRSPDGRVEALVNRTTRAGTDGVLWAASDEDAPVRWTLVAGVHDQRPRDVSGDDWLDIPGYTRVTARPRLFLGEGASTLMITAGGTHEERRGGGTGSLAADRRTLDTRRFDAGAIGQHLAGGLLLSGRVALAEHRRTHGYPERTEQERLRTGFVEGAVAGVAGAHTWVAGAALHHDAFRNDDVGGFDHNITTPGVFAQDTWSPAEVLALALSLRADRPSGRDVLLSPRASLLLRAGEWSLRLSGGGGSHVPGHRIEDIDEIGLGALAAPQPLAVEHARSGSVDLGRTLGIAELNATVFGSVIEDAVALVRTVEGPIVTNVPGDTRTRGGELLARVHAGALHATLSYAYTRSTEPDPENGGRREVELTPRHAAGLVAALEDEDRGRVGFELYYTGRQALHDDPYRTRSRPYAVFGVLAERKFGDARVFVNLENIGDVRQSDHGPVLRLQPTPEGVRTVAAWAPLDGRVINFGVRWHLRGDEHDH